MRDSAQWLMHSEIGPLHLVASAQGLRGVFWREQAEPRAGSLLGSDPRIRALASAVAQLEEYFQGERQAFELELAPEGTDFQRRVWKELAAIPYGATCSYREIARRIGQPGAVRAVGSANGRNPLSIIVPCHRVIAADGTLGGYAGGVAVKARLLELERGSTPPRP